DDVAGLVETELRGVEQDVAVQIELDETRSVHLVVQQAVRIDEECTFFAGHSRADVVGAHLGHAVEVRQPIRRGEIDALVPFSLADLLANGLAFLQRMDGHGVLTLALGSRLRGSIARMPAALTAMWRGLSRSRATG